MTTGTLTRGAAALALAAATLGIGAPTTATAQDKKILACTGGNASTNPDCYNATNPKPPADNQPVVVQTAVNPVNSQTVELKPNPVTFGINWQLGGTVGAPNPSSGLAMGYISRTTSSLNTPIGTFGRATGTTEPLPGILELHIETQKCLNGVATSKALGDIPDTSGVVAYKQLNTVVAACDSNPHAFNALVFKATECPHGVTITGGCRDKPAPTPLAPAAPLPAAPAAASAPVLAAAPALPPADLTRRSGTPPKCSVTITSNNTSATQANLIAERKRLEKLWGCTMG